MKTLRRRSGDQSFMAPVFELHRDIDQLFDEFMNPLLNSDSPSSQRSQSFMPVCDVEEKSDRLLFNFELPGVKKEDIKIEVLDHELSVSGTRHSVFKKEEGSKRLEERTYGEF